MAPLTFVAILASTGLIVLLGLGDPKRLRVGRSRRAGHGAMLRRLLAAAALMPGLIFIFEGDAAAFLLWLSGSAVAGWAVSIGLPAPESP